MENIKWDKIRVLVTNKCNYRCPFCHNEGQPKERHRDMMTFESFKKFTDIIQDHSLSELNFSGGEPFLNPEIVEMILYANDNLRCDISCATNLSLISENQIKELACTRVKFNIQFPYVSNAKFIDSTGTGNLEKIISNIETVKKFGISIGLNCVIQSMDVKGIESMIQFALAHELPLKLLPQIGLVGSDNFLSNMTPIIQRYSVDFINKGTGCLKWILKEGEHQINLLYIQSPCFNKEIDTCKRYGEVRIHPDFSLQSCIMQEPITHLCIEKGKDYVLEQLENLWNNFNHC